MNMQQRPLGKTYQLTWDTQVKVDSEPSPEPGSQQQKCCFDSKICGALSRG